MITRTLLILTAALAISAAAKADDHLFEALQHGLTPDSHAFVENPAGNSGDLALGQGSPFSGHDMQTPATDSEAANEHANVKPRQPK